MSNFLWGCSQLTNMGNMLPSEQYESTHLSHNVWDLCRCLMLLSCLSFFSVILKIFVCQKSYEKNKENYFTAGIIILKKVKMLIVDHHEMHKRECDDHSDVLKQKHMCMNHMLHYFWVFHSHGLSAAGDLSSVFTQQICWCAQSLIWKYICIVFVWQEHESATGPGWELRAGPDLHHREDHFCLLPQ